MRKSFTFILFWIVSFFMVMSQNTDSIHLPFDMESDEKVWGVIYNSVGNLYAEPRFDSELVTQGLLGTPVRISEVERGWRRVQTPDKYTGWINGAVTTMTKAELQQYLQNPKVIVTSLTASSRENTDDDYSPVSDLVAGNLLELKGAAGDFYLVVYPDGREACIRKSDAAETADWFKYSGISGENMVRTAYRFMGIPYLWGGTSPKGLDCSGFTKTVYFLHGILLPRDASQQALSGKLIDASGDFSDALPGDLVFFGSKATGDVSKEKVVHVGIYIGNKRFIHASDYVRINSFDPSDTVYDAFNTNRYLRTKRILGEADMQRVEDIGKIIF